MLFHVALPLLFINYVTILFLIIYIYPTFLGCLGGILKNFIPKHAHACVFAMFMGMRTCSLEFFKIYGPKSQKGFLVVLGCMQIGLYLAKLSAQFWMVQPCLSTTVENLI